MVSLWPLFRWRAAVYYTSQADLAFKDKNSVILDTSDSGMIIQPKLLTEKQSDNEGSQIWRKEEKLKFLMKEWDQMTLYKSCCRFSANKSSNPTGYFKKESSWQTKIQPDKNHPAVNNKASYIYQLRHKTAIFDNWTMIS